MAHLLFFMIMAATAFQSELVQVSRSDDYRFSFKHVFEPDADKHLVEAVNMKKFREDFFPHAKYYGVLKDDVDSRLTYRFKLEKPIARARLRANLITCNFENNKIQGMGQSEGSLWCSTDGRNWMLLLDCPMPKTGVLMENPVNHFLPDVFKGKTEIWFQVRMKSKDHPEADYCVAQFCRLDDEPKDFNAPVFDLRVTFQKK